MMFENLVNSSEGGVYIIAEACDNHMGSFEIARALCRAAKASGSNAVKFQHHIANEEMLRDAKMSDNFEEHLFDFLEENSLSLKQHEKLKLYCDEIDIQYLCTPFSLQAAKEIAPLVPFFKIGSGEFQDHWFIDGLSKIGKPVLFSTGMADISEVVENVEYLRSTGLEFALLNCLSEYPPKFEDMQLKVIIEYINKFPDIVIGHSDHTQTDFTSVIAVSLGARIIEKHLTVSPLIHGPDRDVSIDPTQFQKLNASLRSVNKVLGSEKVLHEKEKAVRAWAYRSVVASQTIKMGEKVDYQNICTKRPGTGIPSKQYKALIGKVVNRQLEIGEMIMREDLL